MIVFTATISQSVFLRVDLVRRALYTTPNSPAVNGKSNIAASWSQFIVQASTQVKFAQLFTFMLVYAVNMFTHFVSYTLSNRFKQVKITDVKNHFFRELQ